LLGFITSNEIGFEIPTSGKEEVKYLIPQLLPEDDQAVQYDRKRLRTTFRLKIGFPFLHRGIVDRLLFRVRKLDYSNSTRSAIIIKDHEQDQGAFVAYLLEEGNQRSILIEAENKRFGVQLLNEVGQLIALDRATLLASATGQVFVPVANIAAARLAGHHTVFFAHEQHELQPLLTYLHLDKDQRLFDGEVAEELLQIDPALRYATVRERVLELMTRGYVEQAIREIPAPLLVGDLLLAVTNFRAAARDHGLGLITDNQHDVARSRLVRFLVGDWG